MHVERFSTIPDSRARRRLRRPLSEALLLFEAAQSSIAMNLTASPPGEMPNRAAVFYLRLRDDEPSRGAVASPTITTLSNPATRACAQKTAPGAIASSAEWSTANKGRGRIDSILRGCAFGRGFHFCNSRSIASNDPSAMA
jgi:hypothetical protein